MKKYFLTPSYWSFFLSVFILFDSYSQNDVPVIVMNQDAEPCVSDQLHEERMLTDSIYRQKTIDLNGCVNSTQANLSVNDCTDLLEIKTDEVLVYPNPASKTVFVKTKTYDIASINVFDATGRLIARYNGQSKNIEVDISNVAIGIYNLEIQIENKVFRTRLVKK